jgi:hypothetical protein
MRKIIETENQVLITCDNPKCDFEIPWIEQNEKNLVMYVNEPCPRCNENLLTEKDYIEYKKLIRTINKFNKWFSWLMWFVPKNTKTYTHTVQVHNGIKINTEVSESSSDL